MTEDLLRSLLDANQKAMIEAQKSMLTTAVQQLEQRHDKRFSSIEAKLVDQGGAMKDVENSIRDLQDRMATVEEGSTTASSDQANGVGSEALRRRMTIVIGGFGRDTRKQEILDQINDTLAKMDVSHLILPFRVRAQEDMPTAKDRMHRVIAAFAQQKPPVKGQPNQCGQGSVRARRSAASVANKLDDVDCDYVLGKVWVGDHLVAAYNDIPPQIDAYKIYGDTRQDKKPWINMAALASSLVTTTESVEHTIHSIIG